MMDFGENEINGIFPYWLDTLPELQVLVLRSNKLQGVLHSPKTIHPFPKLWILDLANNEFIGPLPKGIIKNMKAMMNLSEQQSSLQYMQRRCYNYNVNLTVKGFYIEFPEISKTFTSIDLSNNNFHGEIPSVIGKLSSLRGLILSHNNLSGHIPTTMGNLPNLEWLDLSSNKLTGQIPYELKDITFLAFLNLPHNQLIGPIPQGKQFSTFENDSYEGNLALCGFPLSKACNNDGRKQSPSFVKEADDSEIKISFGWKVVLIGYGCGLIFGVIVRYVTFRNGEPKWFVTLYGVKYRRKGRRYSRN
ncbi:Receptor like protein 53, putative [Theobroma cacao]|uniref:Receptor like protein 53, putative n=1 Tax=Theobroma cacao TaxID=3641 RepID=A0A061F606_THECC|nr:Receptor like protein 53, putative [Theobroma cacao]